MHNNSNSSLPCSIEEVLQLVFQPKGIDSEKSTGNSTENSVLWQAVLSKRHSGGTKWTRVVFYYTTNAARTVSKQCGTFWHLIGWLDICFNEQLIWYTTCQWLQGQFAGSFDFFMNTHWLVYVSVFMPTGEVVWHHCGRWSHLDTRWVVNLEFLTHIQVYIYETTVN